MLGDFAANTGRPDIAQKVYDHALNFNLPIEDPALMLVESRIVAGNYQSAIELTREFMEANPDWETRLAPIFNGLQSIAYFAMGDRESASLYLDSFLNLPTIRAENLVAVSNRLRKVGASRRIASRPPARGANRSA
ncbi:MAG: hypothetical protein J6386_18050 [Candidatus Synoicihabitans palmerolidicus]|nr:hypothetical protein [Candidatus Synoicihabitans palmerolidicus]